MRDPQTIVQQTANYCRWAQLGACTPFSSNGKGHSFCVYASKGGTCENTQSSYHGNRVVQKTSPIQ